MAGTPRLTKVSEHESSDSRQTMPTKLLWQAQLKKQSFSKFPIVEEIRKAIQLQVSPC